MEKLHVMHMVLSLATGGCENGIVNLINNMSADRFKVSVCCLEETGELAERIAYQRRNVHLVKRSPRPGPIDLLRVVRLLRRQKVDILHTHGWGTLAFGYLCAKLARVPHVVHGEHGILEFDKRRRIVAQRLLLQRVDATVTVSQDLKRRICGALGLGGASLHPIINGVDSVKFNSTESHRAAAIRKELGLGNTSFLMGSAGRLVAVKRFDLLIEAAEKMYRSGADAYLVIVGDGPLRDQLRAMIEARGLNDRCFLVGRKDNVCDYLRAMDVFVTTSEFEGISNTILEAMACGVATVATRVGGTPEIIADEDTGYLFDSGDQESLLRILSMLISDQKLRVSTGRRARSAVETSFSLARMVERYEELYLGVTGMMDQSGRLALSQVERR